MLFPLHLFLLSIFPSELTSFSECALLLCGHCWNKSTGRFPTVSVFFCVYFHILRFSTQHLKTCIQNTRPLCCVLLILYHWTGHAFCNYKQMYCFSKLPPVSKKSQQQICYLNDCPSDKASWEYFHSFHLPLSGQEPYSRSQLSQNPGLQVNKKTILLNTRKRQKSFST